MVLSQGCRMGRTGLVAFLPQDIELWLLLCGEQYCFGVAIFWWFPCLVTALDSRSNLCQHFSGFLRQNVDHQGPSVDLKKYCEQPLLTLKSRAHISVRRASNPPPPHPPTTTTTTLPYHLVYLLNGDDTENTGMCGAQIGLSRQPKRV